jgi:hypothetical protein
MRNHHVETFDRFRAAWQRLCRRWTTHTTSRHSGSRLGNTRLRCEVLETRETPNDLLGALTGNLLAPGGSAWTRALFSLPSLLERTDSPSPSVATHLEPQQRAVATERDRTPPEPDQQPGGQAVVFTVHAGSAVGASDVETVQADPSGAGQGSLNADPFADLFNGASRQAETAHPLSNELPEHAGGTAGRGADSTAPLPPASSPSAAGPATILPPTSTTAATPAT